MNDTDGTDGTGAPDGTGTGDVPDTVTTAHRLSVAITRLRSRLREESGTHEAGLSISQFSLLRRITDEGPVTAAGLAAAEHVSPQSVAQNLTVLKAAGLVHTRRDPDDGRRTLITAADAGDALLRSIRASRTAWLVQAIETLTEPGERATLDAAVDLLERLIASDVHTDRRGGGRRR
ncbi:MarR family winged helix-turn-helix transcriptional regulator [Streptomyces sp. RFCAC02]|uniref:MarR family winged helix-turn-helix transcriptional regulator n=1 Tax=Streptomyces sp. RFCAC02 TaxID=2499143 RepID=UPI00101EC47B|nr:MarR family winged helix-turn-helix transcriptional regulator [Streptomyces sp. RFCAC02]